MKLGSQRLADPIKQKVGNPSFPCSGYQAKWKAILGIEGCVWCFQADLRDTFPGVVCRYPDKGFDDNYCRNPDGKPRPWCYTLDPDTPWEYCAIKMCGKLGSNLLLPFPLTDWI